MIRVATVMLVVLCLVTGSAVAKDAPPTNVTPKSANAAFTAGDHENAARQYRALVDQDATKLGAWYRLGMSLLHLGRNIESAQALDRAAGAPLIAANARYNQACALAKAGKLDDAFGALNKAVKAGFVDVFVMKADADLRALRSDERFASIVDAMRYTRRGVLERQFDFWVGSWDVRDPRGKVLGTSVITRRQKGRIIHEAWTSKGGTGESMNFYDAGRGLWRQVWVDAQGNVVEYAGQYKNGAMRMQGRKSLANGTQALARATFFENDDGSVRQLLEQSKDGGRTWSTLFDGRYTRREE